MCKKIFIGLTEIAGYYGGLKKGLIENGVDCTFINLSNHPFQYGGDDEPIFFVNLCKWNIRQMSKYSSKLMKAPFYLISQILRIPIFLWALCKYDVFIFGFGQSFFRLWDLPILKACNKKIIFIFNGSDGRPPYIGVAGHSLEINDIKNITQKIVNNLQIIEHYADLIVTHTASSHLHQKHYVKFLVLGIPFSHSDPLSTEISRSQEVIRILHSPSNPTAKGSAFFKKSIEFLSNKGYEIEYIEITGRPHSEVIALLQTCDFVLDQVYSDTPMAGFATEAAFFAKPAIVGGYYAEYINKEYDPEDIPPSLFCHPDDITDAIEKLIVDPGFREELGRKAQMFVQSRWTPKEVAKKYLQIINGDIPQSWIGDPQNIIYLQGGGLPESKSKEIIREMIEQYGIESLCLSDKPQLEQRFKEYAFGTKGME